MYRGEKNKLDSFRKEKQDERKGEREREREGEESSCYFSTASAKRHDGALHRITQGIENSSGSWSLSARFVSRRAVENNPHGTGEKALSRCVASRRVAWHGVESRVQTNPLPTPSLPFVVPGSRRNYEHSVTIPTRLTG